MIMKKSVALIIAFCMVVLACVPSNSVKASLDSIRIKTHDSVSGYWSDADLQSYQDIVSWYDGSHIDLLYELYDDFNIDSGFSPSFYYIETNSSSQWTYHCVCFNDRFIEGWLVVPGNGSLSFYNKVYANFKTETRTSASNMLIGKEYRFTFNLSDGTITTTAHSDLNIAYNTQSFCAVTLGGVNNSNICILDSDIPVFYNQDIVDNGGPVQNGPGETFINSDKSAYTNFMPDNLPYEDSQGNIVTPSPSVSFSDTAYNGGISFDYQQTHLYTEYNNAQGANETCVFKWALDSRSQSITQTTTDWKMHYYVIVNWHWTQATDSSVYTPLLSGGSGGQMAFEFDDVPEFIMQGKTKISIWDLVQNVPTVSSVRDEDIVSLAVAVSCLNGNIVNSVWKDIFGQSGQYVGDVASEIISGGKLEVQGVGEVGGSFINNLFNPAYYYALDDLRVNLVAHPWSETLAIHGGNGDFDLNLCTNVSYGTTQGYVDDGGTPDNPSDDMQYPTNTVPQQNNVVVPVTYPTSGGNVTVYSVVQVPHSGGGGGNSINYSPTFSPSIVMDSGLDDLKETVDAYPQVPNQHFWDYFLVFKDNAFLDATSDFFGALPNELSSLLISSIGIIGVFAIYRFVRRR